MMGRTQRLDRGAKAVSAGSRQSFAAARAALFYARGSLLLVAIWNKWLLDVNFISDDQASQIGHNSEGYLFALLLCAWIQWVLPWAERRDVVLILSFAASAASFTIGLW